MYQISPLTGLVPVIWDHHVQVFEDFASVGSRSVVLMANGAIVYGGPADDLLHFRDLLNRHIGVSLKT